MLGYIDRQLNGLTMYRLLAYGLGVVLALAALLAATDRLPFTMAALLASVAVLAVVCYFSNLGLARLYGVPANSESSLITALILACILNPTFTVSGLLGIALAGLLAMASKYVLTLHHSHIFNPVAFGAVVIGLLKLARVSWWVGSEAMLPIVLIFGLLILRKIRRWEMALSFVAVAVTIIVGIGVFIDMRPFAEVLAEAFTSWPVLFFATVMLTEPLTAPPTRYGRLAYAVVVAGLFASRWHIGTVYTTPALALVVGNLFSLLISNRQRLVLTLKEVVKMSPTSWDFVFSAAQPLRFTAGQYAEWTLPVKKGDDRGNRRTFTIASAPSEKDVHLGVKFYEPSSSFKEVLHTLKVGDQVLMGPVMGDFVLPKQSVPLLFLAGGIGITPFRSLLKELMARKEKIDVVLIYSARSSEEVAYGDVLDEAVRQGLKITYLLSDPQGAPASWKVETGILTSELLTKLVPDAKERLSYSSGPTGFVDASSKALRKAGVRRRNIKKDYFPGY